MQNAKNKTIFASLLFQHLVECLVYSKHSTEVLKHEHGFHEDILK